MPALPVGAEKAWKAGERCKALYAEDGKWYDARIESTEDLAGYTVTWLDFGTSSVVPDDSSLNSFPQ